jgi:hypothetical protein
MNAHEMLPRKRLGLLALQLVMLGARHQDGGQIVAHGCYDRVGHRLPMAT